MKAFRIDLMVALCALLISAIAASASVYQTRIIAKQNDIVSQEFSATTWPYLVFSSTYSATSVELDVRNNGVGPAILHSVDILVDGVPVSPRIRTSAIETAVQPAITAAIREAAKSRPREAVHTSTSSLSGGDVIPAGGTVALVRADGAIVTRHLMVLRPHVDVKFCYCSLVGRCWTRDMNDVKPIPRDITKCPLLN